MLKKVVYAGTRCGSFALAAAALRELAEVEVPVKQVERRTQQIGTERCAERDAAAMAFEARPLVERKEAPPGVPAPPIAVVQMDGGRLQIRDRTPESPNAPVIPIPTPVPNNKGNHWREDKVGLLASMARTTGPEGPCPCLPEHFIDPQRIPRLAQEIKSSANGGGRAEVGDAGPGPDPTGAEPGPATGQRYEPPELVVRSVVSTKQGVEVFDRLLAAAAWVRGFYGADRRVFLGDGSNANWGVWARHFSSFTPVVDFIHALAYVYGRRWPVIRLRAGGPDTWCGSRPCGVGRSGPCCRALRSGNRCSGCPSRRTGRRIRGWAGPRPGATSRTSASA
ncbi:hypothetical protein R5W24_004348 [Gemmata sp. JC717]|uniref:hypothetical protein n=1 Tax=Gemmata algarum TaxID=2975278 RepID=UPI0021BA7D7C|nr:hypothetical protein [Gemmata algarum]MDY3555210.1 hypothetical protein [Gemmata algarum]